MIADLVTDKPVPVDCPKCGARRAKDGRWIADGSKGGVMFRVDLSRLEEGLGHEGFKCNKCGHTIKYVPKKKGGA